MDEELNDKGRLAGVEAIFRGFELGEEVVRIVGSGRHERRDSVTQFGDGKPTMARLEPGRKEEFAPASLRPGVLLKHRL